MYTTLLRCSIIRSHGQNRLNGIYIVRVSEFIFLPQFAAILWNGVFFCFARRGCVRGKWHVLPIQYHTFIYTSGVRILDAILAIRFCLFLFLVFLVDVEKVICLHLEIVVHQVLFDSNISTFARSQTTYTSCSSVHHHRRRRHHHHSHRHRYHQQHQLLCACFCSRCSLHKYTHAIHLLYT